MWEDHYRLFEALCSGALVMTDRMLSLPEGLQDGVSLVEFSSIDELKAKVLHYLRNSNERIAIATRGKRIAMERHRSWHRMEEVVFGGRRPSECPHDNDDRSKCVFKVDNRVVQ